MSNEILASVFARDKNICACLYPTHGEIGIRQEEEGNIWRILVTICNTTRGSCRKIRRMDEIGRTEIGLRLGFYRIVRAGIITICYPFFPRGYRNMGLGKMFDTTTIVFGLLALIIFLLLWSRDPSIAKATAQSGLLLFLRHSFLIIFSMLIATMLPTLISREIIVQYLGGASGWRGILMATLLGGLTPGAPYAVVPLIAGLMKQGMSFAPAMSMVCAWGLWSLGRVPFQAAVLGGRFTLIQVLVSLPLPLIAGFFTELLLKFI